MRSSILLSIVALSACTSKAQEAEANYLMVANETADVGMYRYRALCPHSKAVAAAYIEEKNAEKYREWKYKSDIECERASDPLAT